MKAYTVKSGLVSAGITCGQAIKVGQDGRGRKLVCVPLPVGAQWDTVPVDAQCGQLAAVPGPEGSVLVLVRDHSGFRGSWGMVERNGVHVVADGFAAQGDAGRMGGGPEYLLRLEQGGSFEIHRSGRLYGAPSRVRIVNVGGVLEAQDIGAMEREAAAAAALKAAMGG